MDRIQENDLAGGEPGGFQCAVSYFDVRAEVVVCGEVDLVTAPTMQREIKTALALPVRAMTVHLGRVTFLDSSGIAALLTVQTSAAELGIAFGLKAVPFGVRRVFELAGVAEALGFEPDSTRVAPAERDAAG